MEDTPKLKTEPGIHDEVWLDSNFGSATPDAEWALTLARSCQRSGGHVEIKKHEIGKPMEVLK